MYAAEMVTPIAGVFKINFNGAIFENMAIAGLGVVVRDVVGLIIVALS